MNKVTRRGFLGSSLAAPLGLGAVSPLARAESAFGDADMVLTGGRVLTMDWYEPLAEAMAIRGGYIVAVGSNDDILNLAGSGTTRIDARGMTVTPGFIDAHSHPLFAEEAVGVNVNLPQIEDVKQALKGQAAKTPPGHWVRGVMYDDTIFEDERPLTRRDIDEVVRDHPADIAVVKQRGSHEIKRVLVPVRGGPHAELAVRFADAIANHHGATVVVLHLVPPGITMAVRAQAERALAAFIKQHLRGHGEAALREAPNVRNAILREAEKADLVVMGASAVPGGDGPDSYLFGALPEAIAARAKPSVVVVKTRESIGRQTFDALASRAETLAAADRAAEEARAVPARVERWFGESNFHHAEFSDLRRLVQLKEKQGVTVSLVLPTLDEEETIGPIVRRAIREMVGRVPLLDEILVIDSASTDRTREIAEAEGARVVQHPDVLSRYGSFRGKGEALWKSLFETTGDIVVWADTDVKNWHHRMVYGTLGPLLHEPRLQYVKGYYQRPIVQEGVLKEGGGGRVTELVARPLINLFYPELSGMIQPLSGEYAGRRTLLESIPFFTGYAVEIGHLIDASERLGIEGLGQVDLERRVHRNQELEGLSRMSFVILQAVMKRLEERRKARLFAELGSTMKLPRSGKGRLSLEVIELADQERPPMIRIPEYLERRRAGGS